LPLVWRDWDSLLELLELLELESESDAFGELEGVAFAGASAGSGVSAGSGSGASAGAGSWTVLCEAGTAGSDRFGSGGGNIPQAWSSMPSSNKQVSVHSICDTTTEKSRVV
jgi:hypothetical protein